MRTRNPPRDPIRVLPRREWLPRVFAMHGIPSFVLGKLEEITSSSQVHDGDGSSRGRELEIRFSASLDNDITLAVTRPPPLRLLLLSSFLFFFLFSCCDTFLMFHCVSLSSLKSGSLFIRVALKSALYLSPARVQAPSRAPVSSCCFPVVILAHT